MRSLTLLYFLVVGLAAGCGRPTIDPTLQPYVDRFQAAALAHGRTVSTSNLSVVFGEVSQDGKQGQCAAGALFGPATVTVSRELGWDGQSELVREELLYHELGHCALLRRNHNDTLRTDVSLPASLMATVLPSEWTYQTYRTDYLDELFAGH